MTRSTRQAIISALLSTGIGLACVSFNIQTDYDPNTSFEQLKTFDWAAKGDRITDDPRVDHEQLETRVHNAATRVLVAAGFQKASGDEPDFLIAYHASIESKVESIPFDMNSSGYDRYDYSGGFQGELLMPFEQGTLILDVIDRASNSLIWRGSAQARLHNLDATPQQRTELVDEAVAAILEKFPPAD